MSEHVKWLLTMAKEERQSHAVGFSAGAVDRALRLETSAAHIERLEALLKECADDLAEWIDQGYHQRDFYPDILRRYERDMGCVYRARAAIRTSDE